MNSPHIHEFEQATTNDFAQVQMIKGVRSLAMTAYDILNSTEMQKLIWEDFEAKVTRYTHEELGYSAKP